MQKKYVSCITKTNPTKELRLLYHQNKCDKGNVCAVSPKQMPQMKYLYSVTKTNATKSVYQLCHQNNKGSKSTVSPNKRNK
jgi:hypothetical protein